MELNAQIKKYRTELNLSQEELAEKVYVTRQTISNWENGKSYPDIHSLLLLSSLFNVSLDQLIKGDVETMKEIINEQEVKKLNLILSRLVDTFISRISLTMLPVPKPHNTACVLSWEEARHWQSRSSGYSSS